MDWKEFFDCLTPKQKEKAKKALVLQIEELEDLKTQIIQECVVIFKEPKSIFPEGFNQYAILEGQIKECKIMLKVLEGN